MVPWAKVHNPLHPPENEGMRLNLQNPHKRQGQQNLCSRTRGEMAWKLVCQLAWQTQLKSKTAKRPWLKGRNRDQRVRDFVLPPPHARCGTHTPANTHACMHITHRETVSCTYEKTQQIP